MDLVVGKKATRSLTVTKEHVQKYAEITGDYNPLHFDEAFAAKTKFRRLVVQGGLTTRNGCVVGRDSVIGSLRA